MLSEQDISRAVRSALAEDVGAGDVTTLAVVPDSAPASAIMVAREPLVVAGLPLAKAVFREISSEVTAEALVSDGACIPAGEAIMRLGGKARPILTGERVALNFVQRLSGIASLTAKYVEAVRGTAAWVLDTRKTTPGLRTLEKYAVCCGGGRNHRYGLYDQVMIKDNHLAALCDEKPNAIAAAVERARLRAPDMIVEVEADTLDQVRQAAAAEADIILLDNMSLVELKAAVEIVGGRCKLEASGGVNLGTIRSIAETGVDFISVGALTHSARAMDIALDFGMQRNVVKS